MAVSIVKYSPSVSLSARYVTLPSGEVISFIICGDGAIPPLAIALITVSIWQGFIRVVYCPIPAQPKSRAVASVRFILLFALRIFPLTIMFVLLKPNLSAVAVIFSLPNS